MPYATLPEASKAASTTKWVPSASGVFARQCVKGLEADALRCQSNVERSLALGTALVPLIGYDMAAAHCEELPDPSVAVKVTFVTPRPSTVPAGGLCVIVTVLHASVAITLETRLGKVA